MKRRLTISFNAPVTLWLVVISFGATLAGILTGGVITEKFFMTYHSSLTDPFTYLRFVTYIFGHSGWSHFIGNASYLLLLGPMLEEKNGGKVMIEVVLITAVITALINYIFFPNVGLCGASGIVFAFIMLSSFTGFREGEIPLTFILVAVIYIGQQIYDGLFLTDNVSNMAHIIGGVIGAFMGYVLNKGGKRR
ncbi:MAG: rhomboid family intramembrane serine protease [Butyrivibrio sp.]|uniref:rhomboid family intramembrane serine protease n=1 Tax=Butyrivibrio sp. TaxID=28121 RepID=UPI0025FFBEC0|nr:rhomboid family intramembrane serine protease [Butyrivibrio sp.]MCR5769658.1 rhomboid family intramembrane serine protease [Butyrivibrio sp.]